MLYSHNEALYSACGSGNVSKVSELLSKEAHVNCHHESVLKVSIVSGHMT